MRRFRNEHGDRLLVCTLEEAASGGTVNSVLYLCPVALDDVRGQVLLSIGARHVCFVGIHADLSEDSFDYALEAQGLLDVVTTAVPDLDDGLAVVLALAPTRPATNLLVVGSGDSATTEFLALLERHDFFADDREHFVVRVKLDGRESYLLWYSASVDGVETADGRLLAWPTELDARSWAKRQGALVSNQEVASYDLDVMSRYVNGAFTASASAKLDFWNLVGDAAVSLTDEDFCLKDQSLLAEYNSLFFAVDVPAHHSPGPSPTAEEEAKIRVFIATGIDRFRTWLTESAQ